MVHGPDVFVLVRLRWMQLRRAVPPLTRVMMAVTLCGGTGLIQEAVLDDPSLAPYIAGGILLAVWTLHQQRQDLAFLQRHVPRARQALALEYAAAILPALIGLLLARSWSAAAAVPLACALPWLPVVRTSNVRGRWLRRLVPVALFEWKALVQGTYPWSLLLWTAALAFCWLPVLPLFLVGGVVLLACNAQEQCEPRSMLLAAAPDARTLLRTKVRGAVRMMAVLLLPVLIGATCFRPDWWLIHTLFGLGMLVVMAFAVVLKYVTYRPNEPQSANGAHLATALVFSILPGLFLVPLIMLLTERPKALANLRSYFHGDPH